MKRYLLLLGFLMCASAATLRGGEVSSVDQNKQPTASWTSVSIDNCQPGCHLQQGVCVCNVYETNGPCHRVLDEEKDKGVFENIQNSIATGMGGTPPATSCQPGCRLQQGVCVCDVYETNSNNNGKFTQCEGKTSWGTASLTCTPGQCCHVDNSGPSCIPC